MSKWWHLPGSCQWVQLPMPVFIRRNKLWSEFKPMSNESLSQWWTMKFFLRWIFCLVSIELSIKNAVEICKNYLSTISRSRDFNVFMNKLLMNCNDWLKIEFNPSLWKGRPTEVSNRVKSQTLAPKASLINLGYRLLMSNMLKLKRKRPITTTSQNHSDDQNTQL